MFQNIVSDLSERLATIENLGFEALENSQTIYNDALSIYRKIYNLESPNVETKYLTDKALSLSRDADRLKTDASTILVENEVYFKRISFLPRHKSLNYYFFMFCSNFSWRHETTEKICQNY